MNKILQYLFTNYIQHSTNNFTCDRVELVIELKQQGFNGEEIVQAFSWLASLLTQQRLNKKTKTQQQTKSIRMYSKGECVVLDTKSRGLLLRLEQNEDLDVTTREFAIKQLINLSGNRHKLGQVRHFLSMMNLLDKEHSNSDGK